MTVCLSFFSFVYSQDCANTTRPIILKKIPKKGDLCNFWFLISFGFQHHSLHGLDTKKIWIAPLTTTRRVHTSVNLDIFSTSQKKVNGAIQIFFVSRP